MFKTTMTSTKPCFNRIYRIEAWLIILIFAAISTKAATITSTATGGTWSAGSTWLGGIAPGSADTAIVAGGAIVTLSGSTTVTNVTINLGGRLNIGSVNALTITNNFVNNGTFTGTTGRLYLTGTAGNFTNAGTFTFGAGRIYFYGNLLGFATHTLTSTQVRFYGNATQSIAGFTTTAALGMYKTGGTATLTGNVTAYGFTINGSGGTLNLGSGLTHTTTRRVTLTNGTLNGGSSTLNVNGVTTTAWTGTGSRFTAGMSTIKFNAAGNQTISASATTFNNLTFSGSGIKTLTTANCTATGIVSIEGTSTVSAAPTYGIAATLRYNTATSRTAGPEWLTSFAASGGVNVTNTGTISLNAAKIFNASVPLTINSGASLTTGNFQLTFGGNFTNSGTFTAGSSPIVINNTMASQSISGFTTTGSVSMTKTSGIATLAGNVSGGALTINGPGGSLNLGAALTHNFNGVVTLSAGALNGGSSFLNENAVSTTAWNGTGSLFTAATGTVNFGAAGAQTLSASATTFNNLTFSNSGIKTLTTANCIVAGTLSLEGTATVSATPSYGSNAALQYNTASSRTAGVEWITPFAALGGVNIRSTGVITMNAAKVFNASVPLTIYSGSSLNTANFQLNFGGSFVNNGGSFTAGSSLIVIENNMAAQGIAGFATTGSVTMTKTAGTATFIGNVNGSGLTLNGNGALNLGAGLTHSFTGNVSGSTGTLNGGSSVLRFAGILGGTGGTFIPGTGTIDYSGTAQSVVVLPYYNLSLSGSGTKTFSGATTVSNAIAIASGVTANLGTGLTHSAVGLSLGGAFQIAGSWGGTGSGAANISTAYFSAGTGKINNNCSVPIITAQPTAPVATCSGSGTQSISVSTSGSGSTYSWRKGGIALTNGGVISGQGTPTLTLTAPTTANAGSYDVVVSGTCSSSLTSNAVTVSVNATPTITTQPSALSICQASGGTFTVATSASGPTYQWQYSTNPVTTWTNTNALTGISGHTTGTLTLASTPLTYNNYNFRCVITTPNSCSTNSNAALLLVSPTSAVGIISDNQAICSGGEPEDNITVSSATGTVQWQRADDAAFTVNLVNVGTNSTTLTPAQVGNLSVTTYFRARVTSGVCGAVTSSTAIVNIATTTWTSASGGSWSNGEPNSTTAAIISYNYTSSEDIYACTLTVNGGANVTISSGDNLNLQGALTVSSGSFTLDNNANLTQSANVTNTGNIIAKRNSASLMRQDYELWSSPVSGQQLQSFSPNTLPTRFYTYNPSTNVYTAVSSPSTTNFANATGYLIRMPNTHPATPTVWAGTFTGSPNNGPYSLTVANGLYYAIGNPYPSSIDADEFIEDNDLTDALYFWRKTNNAATSSYATYTTAGGVSNFGADPLSLIPNGFIQIGQGFIVKATSTSLDFTNSMRIGDNSNQFLRSDQSDRSRIWLDLTNNEGFYGQMMVCYMDSATLDIDDAIDGRYFNDCPTALTSIINEEEFSIQGRPLPFETTDIVPLGFKSFAAGQFTIALSKVDGLFSEDEDNQTVYLKDNLTNVVHNLSESPYSFATEAGVYHSRFEVWYGNFLTTPIYPFTPNAVVVYKNGSECVVNAGKIIIAAVSVYDTQGRLLFERKNIDASETRFPLPKTREVLVVKVTSTDNEVVSKKIIN